MVRIPGCCEIVGRCGWLFVLGVLFDVIGFVAILVGIFGQLEYFDFFIFSGAAVVFLSLLWWSFWYSFNLALKEPIGQEFTV